MKGLSGFGVLCAASMLACTSQVALADDPNDPAMRTRAAREADAAIIRKLNTDQLAYVRQRDAEYAKDWAAYRAYYGDDRARESDVAETQPRGVDQDYAETLRQYQTAREEYQAQLAQWREDVSACRSGNYERCAR